MSASVDLSSQRFAAGGGSTKSNLLGLSQNFGQPNVGSGIGSEDPGAMQQNYMTAGARNPQSKTSMLEGDDEPNLDG